MNGKLWMVALVAVVAFGGMASVGMCRPDDVIGPEACSVVVETRVMFHQPGCTEIPDAEGNFEFRPSKAPAIEPQGIDPNTTCLLDIRPDGTISPESEQKESRLTGRTPSNQSSPVTSGTSSAVVSTSESEVTTAPTAVVENHSLAEKIQSVIEQLNPELDGVIVDFLEAQRKLAVECGSDGQQVRLEALIDEFLANNTSAEEAIAKGTPTELAMAALHRLEATELLQKIIDAISPSKNASDEGQTSKLQISAARAVLRYSMDKSGELYDICMDRILAVRQELANSKIDGARKKSEKLEMQALSLGQYSNPTGSKLDKLDDGSVGHETKVAIVEAMEQKERSYQLKLSEKQNMGRAFDKKSFDASEERANAFEMLEKLGRVYESLADAERCIDKTSPEQQDETDDSKPHVE